LSLDLNNNMNALSLLEDLNICIIFLLRLLDSMDFLKMSVVDEIVD